MKKLITTLLLIGLISLMSCKKDQNSVKNVNATVYYANNGTIANDCGYLIRIDNTSYFAINLANNFKKDQLQIVIDYHILNTKYQCGSLPSGGISELNIDRIALK